MRGAGRKAPCATRREACPGRRMEARAAEHTALPRPPLPEKQASRGATRTAALTSCPRARGKSPLAPQAFKTLSTPAAGKGRFVRKTQAWARHVGGCASGWLVDCWRAGGMEALEGKVAPGTSPGIGLWGIWIFFSFVFIRIGAHYPGLTYDLGLGHTETVLVCNESISRSNLLSGEVKTAKSKRLKTINTWNMCGC